MKHLRLLLLGQLHMLVVLGAEDGTRKPPVPPKEIAGYLITSKVAPTGADFSLIDDAAGAKSGTKVLITLPNERIEEKVLATVIRTPDGLKTKELTRLYDGATPADVEPVRAAILANLSLDFLKFNKASPSRARVKAPTADDTFISRLTKTKAGFEATFETDQSPMAGVGAEVKLSRQPDGYLSVTAWQGFKK